MNYVDLSDTMVPVNTFLNLMLRWEYEEYRQSTEPDGLPPAQRRTRHCFYLTAMTRESLFFHNYTRTQDTCQII